MNTEEATMNNRPHTTSDLLICAGALLAMSGILMAVCGELAYGSILWAAASCMFISVRQFRLAENKTINKERSDDEQATV